MLKACLVIQGADDPQGWKMCRTASQTNCSISAEVQQYRQAKHNTPLIPLPSCTHRAPAGCCAGAPAAGSGCGDAASRKQIVSLSFTLLRAQELEAELLESRLFPRGRALVPIWTSFLA